MKILRILPLLILGATSAFAQATTPFMQDTIQLTRINQNGQNYFPTVTLSQVQQLFAASQQTVNAGTDNTTFVTPLTLAGALGGGGALGSMARQNSNNVSITGGSISIQNFNSNSGSNNSFTTTTLLGSVSMGNGALAGGGYPVFTPYSMPALAIDTTQQWNTVNLTDSDTGHPSEVLTFTGTPGSTVQQFVCLVTNTSTSVVHTPTIPSSFSFNRASTSTTFRIQPLTSVLLVWDFDGTTYWLRGDPVFINDLPTKATPVGADLDAIADSASNFSTKQVTLSSLGQATTLKSVTFVFNGNGGVLSTGVKYGGIIKIPYAGTIVGYAMACYPAATGNNAVDLLRSTNGNGTPVTSIIGGGTKPFISTSSSTSTTENSAVVSGLSWTSSTLNTFDNLVPQITAADGTVQFEVLTVYYQ